MEYIKEQIRLLDQEGLIDFCNFFKNHMKNLFETKTTNIRGDPLRQQILDLDPEENYKEFYKLETWLFLYQRDFSLNTKTGRVLIEVTSNGRVKTANQTA